MDRFSALQALVSVVEAEGFAAAARRLGKSRSSVNRLVIDLEDQLGTQLLNRTTRHVAPTANGLAFYQRAKAILSSLDEAERAMSDAQEHATGQLRINAPMSFGTLYLGPALSDFMLLHPDVRVELTLNDRIVDIIEEGYDLTVRIAEPEEEATFVDFRLCAIQRLLCASPDYVGKNGAPATPTELRGHACLNYGMQATDNRWRLLGPDGPVTVRLDSVLCSNNGEVLRDGAVKGLGIALLPGFIAGPELQAGRLVTVMEQYQASELTLSVIYPPSRHLSAKVRLLTDFLTDRFGENPGWELEA